MNERPVATRYVVSTQGNRNLVADHPSNTSFPLLDDARKYARRKATEERSNYYVHEIKVSTLFVLRPQVAVEEEL